MCFICLHIFELREVAKNSKDIVYEGLLLVEDVCYNQKNNDCYKKHKLRASRRKHGENQDVIEGEDQYNLHQSLKIMRQIN